MTAGDWITLGVAAGVIVLCLGVGYSLLAASEAREKAWIATLDRPVVDGIREALSGFVEPQVKN